MLLLRGHGIKQLKYFTDRQRIPPHRRAYIFSEPFDKTINTVT